MLTIRSVSLDDARRMIAAGEHKARETDSPSNFAVVDAAGHLIMHVRMDGAQLGSIHHALDKAFTSAMLRSATGDLAVSAQPGGALYGLDGSIGGRVITFAGGIPVVSNDAIIGAIGVSGGTAEQDQAVAEAAIVSALQHAP